MWGVPEKMTEFRIGTAPGVFGWGDRFGCFWESGTCNYTILQNKRMRRCGVASLPIIFERLKLPQQIIYRRKGNLSESPKHQKYCRNILISDFMSNFREVVGI